MNRSGRGLEFLFLSAATVLFALGFRWTVDSSEFDPLASGEDRIRVVSWNLGQELRAGAGALLREHEAHVLARLRKLKPDILCLQEVQDKDQVERLRRGLGSSLGSTWSSATSRRSAGPLAVLLVKDATLASPTPAQMRRLRGRVAMANLHFELPRRAAFDLSVATVHAEAFSPAERNAFLGQVREQLDSFSGSYPRLLAGDFNIDLNPEARRDLFSDDAYLDVQTYNALLAPGSSRVGLFDSAAKAGPTAEPDRRLDYILTEPDQLRVLQAGPWLDQRAPGMDHDPLVVDLHLNLAKHLSE